MECMQYTIRDIPGCLDSGIMLYMEPTGTRQEDSAADRALAEMRTIACI